MLTIFTEYLDRRLVRRIRADVDAPHRQPVYDGVGWQVDEGALTLEWVDLV